MNAKKSEIDVWREVQIGDLGPFVTSGSRGWGKYYATYGDAFIRITNMSRDKIQLDITSLRYVNLPKYEREGLRTSVQDGDVIISITADIGIAGFVDAKIPKPAYINQHIASVRFPKSAADGRFVAYYIASEGPQKTFRAMTDTGAKAGMSLSTVRKIRVAVPPLPEQKAIAAALGHIDDLIASLDALIAKKRDIKQAAMQQLLTGKTRLPGFSQAAMISTDVGMIPSDWEIAKLADLGHPVIGLTYRPQDVRESGTLVLRSSNVQNGDLCFQDNVFVEPSVARNASVHQGDILICVRNGSRALIGKCAMIDERAAGTAFGAFMSVYRSQHSGFIFHYFHSDIIKRQINDHLGATINQITHGSLRSFAIPFPSDPAEREAIAQVLYDMDREVGSLIQRGSKLRRLRDGIMQQLLTGRIRLV